MMAAAGKLGTKMKKIQIPDVDPVSILYQVQKYFAMVTIMITSGGSRFSPRRGRQLPKGEGRQHTILPYFPKNCMKLKEFWPRGASLAPPLDPPLITVFVCQISVCQF